MLLFPLNKIISLNPIFSYSIHRWVSGERNRSLFDSKPQNYSTVRPSLCFSMVCIGSFSPLHLHHSPNKYLRESKSKNGGVSPCLLSQDVEADYMPSATAIQAQRPVGYFCIFCRSLCQQLAEVTLHWSTLCLDRSPSAWLLLVLSTSSTLLQELSDCIRKWPKNLSCLVWVS